MNNTLNHPSLLVILAAILVFPLAACRNNRARPLVPDGPVFPVGSGPLAICSDGTNIWIANSDAGSVSELRGSDGATFGVYAAGSVWVCNYFDDNVTRLSAQ